MVRAGLIYKLLTDSKEHGNWQILPVIRPGAKPLDELTAVVAKVDEKYSEHLLVVEQFEEVFTLCKDEEQQEAFFAQLLALTDLYVVIVMRADFFAHCIAKPNAGLGDRIKNNLFTITAMTTEELQQAIEEPAEKVGFRVQDLLTLEIIKDIEGSPGNLPLLQYTLEQVFQTDDANQQLTLEAYQRLGGLKGALAKKADELYQGFSESEQETVKWLFLELMQLGEGQEDTRKQLTLVELERNLAHRVDLSVVIAKLTQERLLIQDKNSSDVTIVDVAHEALIREWARLRGWIDENRDFKRWRDDLSRDMKVWVDAGREKDALLRGPKLAAAKEYLENHHKQLNQGEIGFIDASIQLQEHEQALEQQRQAERERLLQEAQQQTRRAKRQAQTLLIEKLGMQSVLATQLPRTGNGHYEQALLLAIQAFKEKDFGTSRSNLLRVLQAQKQQRIFLYGHSDHVSSVAFSPDGKIIASGSCDNTVRLWDVQTKQPLGGPLVGHSYNVTSVAFSPDGKILASGSRDKTVRLWDIETRRLLGKPLVGHSNYVECLAFSPDNQTIASGSIKGTIRLWNVSSLRKSTAKPDSFLKVITTLFKTIQKKHDKQLIGHLSSVNSIAFSPDSQILVSGSADKTIRFWDVQTQQPLGDPLDDHCDAVRSVAFSPNGQILASAGNDKTVRLWDVDMRQPFCEQLVGHFGSIRSVVFSPDGQTIASGGDKTVRLWDVQTQQLLSESLVGHSSEVESVAFSPDGRILASGSYDDTIRLWDVKMRQSLGKPLVGHFSTVVSLAFSPDTQILVSGSPDETVRLWNINKRQALGEPLFGHSNFVNSVAFSPNGQIIASGSIQGNRSIKVHFI